MAVKTTDRITTQGQSDEAPQNQPFSNNGNRDFYENISLEDFENFAKVIGLETGADVNAIYPYLASCSSIMEIGAGYGRVIDCLIKKDFKGKIYAVERVAHLASLIRHRFGDYTEVLEQDLKDIQLAEKINCVLWLWSGVMELAPDEQHKTLKNLYDLLASRGTLFLETPEKIHYIGEQYDHQMIKFTTNWGTINAYFPEKEEVKARLREVGFRKINVFYYTVRNNRRLFFRATK